MTDVCPIQGCNRRNAVRRLLMCVHEHIRTGPVCDQHAGSALYCSECVAVDGHECLLRELERATL